MFLFTYKDNNKGNYENGQWVAPIICSCLAKDITQADEFFKQETGKEARLLCHVGCCITPMGD
jgi:hypothetical protein